jgi:transcriptional regulator with XRE-family HTH domain
MKAQGEAGSKQPSAQSTPAKGDGFDADRRRLGLRIRELRRLRSLTTRRLASQAGVSPSLISQLENGHVDASVVTLRRIAASLDVPIAHFFLAPGDGASSSLDTATGNGGGSALVSVVRRDRRKRLVIPQSNFVFELLTPDLQGSIEFAWFELAPGHPQEESMAHPRGGEECALVLEGTMHLVIGDEEYVLGPGDSCVFDPSIPHRIENRGKTKLIQISAISPPSF